MRQLSTTIKALKRDLYMERKQTASLEQRLQDMSKVLASCPKGYAVFREICYKAFDTEKTFSGAAAACAEDGGTLAMPRDAETNAYLISLYTSVRDNDDFWFGLHDQREEGSYEWADGSALGIYNSWGPEQPDNHEGRENCVLYSKHWNEWNDLPCDSWIRFICQAVPGTYRSPTIS
ncbi:C-type lectin LmsL-like [Branchiostoma floridae x Branchiostoma japonicum]